MRILIVAPIYPPATGGCATYFKIVTDHLTEEEEVEAITVLTGKLKGSPRKEVKGKVTVLRRLPALPNASTRMGWIFGEAWRGPVSFLSTMRAIMSEKPDVVHIHKTRSHSGALSAARFLGKPSIVDVRDLHTLRSFRRADEFIACGITTRDMLLDEKVPRERVHLLPVPFERDLKVDEAAFRRLSRKGLRERFILYVGDLSAMKGVPELVGAYRGLLKAKGGIDLVLVGRDMLEGGMDDLVKGSKGIHVLDPLPHAEVLGLVKMAEVLILPSRFEGFPRTCVEGVMLGRKVVFPPVVPEFKKKVPGFVLEEVSVDAIERILKKVNASDERPRYPLEEHDAGKVCGKLLDIYRRAIKG